jgi:hypothetical protein
MVSQILIYLFPLRGRCDRMVSQILMYLFSMRDCRGRDRMQLDLQLPM